MGAHSGNFWLCHMCECDLFLNVYFAAFVHSQPLWPNLLNLCSERNECVRGWLPSIYSIYVLFSTMCSGCNISWNRKCKLKAEMTSSASNWTMTFERFAILTYCTYFSWKYSRMTFSLLSYLSGTVLKYHYNTMSSLFSHQQDSFFETLFQRSVHIAASLWLSSSTT